jgi:hypothetical protein
MTVSELIAKLQNVLEKDGNINVYPEEAGEVIKLVLNETVHPDDYEEFGKQ